MPTRPTPAEATAAIAVGDPIPEDGHLLEVDDLRTTFTTPRGSLRAVDGVSFTLDRGRTLGIVGESGSGKTVLSRSVINLLPRRGVVRSGTVHLAGRELSAVRPKDMPKIWGAEVGLILQDPMTSLNPVMKIGAQLVEPLQLHLQLPHRRAVDVAVALLTSVGMPAPERRMDEYPHQLSGGMRQRVTIAVALTCGPKLLIADEPTTALDVTVQRQILDLLADQQQDRHMGMLLITHDLGVVAGRADDIAVMYAGRIVERAPTRTLFHHHRHPYTQGLLRSIPRLSEPSHAHLAAIPGSQPDLASPPGGCSFAPRCPNVQDRCRTSPPPLERVGPDHEVACYFPVGA